MNEQSVKYPILLLDADDTLFDFQQAEQNALEQLMEDFGYSCNENERTQYRNINDCLLYTSPMQNVLSAAKCTAGRILTFRSRSI